MKILVLVPWSQNWWTSAADKKIGNKYLSMISSFLHLFNTKVNVNWCNFSHATVCYPVSCKGLVNDVETVADRQACNWAVWRHNTRTSSKFSEPLFRGDSGFFSWCQSAKDSTTIWLFLWQNHVSYYLQFMCWHSGYSPCSDHVFVLDSVVMLACTGKIIACLNGLPSYIV